eukprot:TRINITY_DN2312_c0_g3_i1.p2 TRINITY_DN2312_c0_g3~~TRINITY_DN2312_c0_g3_i1.p2  ORF type:complete len:184 (-),score=69.56 TRINITY_DN2312_c0_g3_i1:260-811(-)
MVPMVGLAYWPLLIWIPLFLLQGLSVLLLGRNMQTIVKSLSMIFVETPLAYILKIVWVVMLVLCLDCLRNALRSPGSSVGDASTLNTHAFEVMAAKEGCLVLAINLVLMPAIMAVHNLMGQVAKLELDLSIMKRQAAQQGEFTKNLLASDKKEADKAVAPQTKMPEKKEESKEDDAELRKRAD